MTYPSAGRAQSVTPLPETTNRLVAFLGGLSRPKAWLCAFGLGLITALGFAPVGTIAGPILGMGLFLLLLAAQPRQRAFGLGWMLGLGQFVLGLRWIAEAFSYQSAMPAWMGSVAVVGLSAFLALYPAIAAWVSRRLTSKIIALSLIFAGAFAVTEILRGLLFTGFAWNPLGVAWLQINGVAQMAALIGANGLTLLAVLAGGSLAALLGARGQDYRYALVMVAPVFLFVGLIIPKIQKPLAEPTGPDFLLVQNGVGIAEKYAANGHEDSILRAVQASVAEIGKSDEKPAAIIWPEAVIEYPLEELPELRFQIMGSFDPETILLAGGVGLIREEGGAIKAATNSLYALNGNGQILARYDKAHLVPGGEYLPLRHILEPLGIDRLVPGGVDFQPGIGAQTLTLPGLPKLGANICYEIIFPGSVIDKKDRPQAIVTVSNDAWFGKIGPYQHHDQARLRAIEEGLPVLRVTPTGVTGLIDQRGVMRASLPVGEAGALRVKLPPASDAPPFAQKGLLIPALLGWLVIVTGLMVNRRKT